MTQVGPHNRLTIESLRGRINGKTAQSVGGRQDEADARRSRVADTAGQSLDDNVSRLRVLPRDVDDFKLPSLLLNDGGAVGLWVGGHD